MLGTLAYVSRRAALGVQALASRPTVRRSRRCIPTRSVAFGPLRLQAPQDASSLFSDVWKLQIADFRHTPLSGRHEFSAIIGNDSAIHALRQ